MPVLAHDDETLVRILRGTRSIAVVGASPDPRRPSNGVLAALQARSDYVLHPVNPLAGEVCGLDAVGSLAELPEPPDMVDVFRRREHLPAIAREAVAVGARSLWLQLGLRDEEAIRIALDGGLDVVADRCLAVEHARLLGPTREIR